MSVSGKLYDKNAGVRKIIITTTAAPHPNSVPNNMSYYCLGFDLSGFQYQIDLQALPTGVTIEQIQPNQVWWVEKRTTLYRLYLYAGQYNPQTRIITTGTLTVPGVYGKFLSTITQSGSPANTPLPMQMDTTVYSNLTTLSGNSIYVGTSGLYLLQVRTQLYQTDNSVDIVYIWPRQNGTDVAWSNTQVTMDRQNGSKIASLNWYIKANKNDYFQLYWQSNSTSVFLQAITSGTTPALASSNMPNVPSIVTKIDRLSS